jgi:hypothetical protein
VNGQEKSTVRCEETLLSLSSYGVEVLEVHVLLPKCLLFSERSVRRSEMRQSIDLMETV